MSHSLAHIRRNDAVHAHVGACCMSMHIVEESPAFSLHTPLPVIYGNPAGTNVMMPTGGISGDAPTLPSMKQKDTIQNSGSVIEFCFSSLVLQPWLADYYLQNIYNTPAGGGNAPISYLPTVSETQEEAATAVAAGEAASSATTWPPPVDVHVHFCGLI